MSEKRPVVIDLRFARESVVSALRSAFPDRPVIDMGDPANADRHLTDAEFAVVWKPDPALFRRATGLTAIFSIDSTFALIGMVVGVGCGFLSWWALHHRGVVVLVPTIATALVSATVCWAVGTLMGPHDFSDRVAAASPGDVVPVDFRLHTWTSLLVWVLGALIVTLILAVIQTVRDQRSADIDQSGSHEVEQSHRDRSDEGDGQQDSDRGVPHPTT